MKNTTIILLGAGLLTLGILIGKFVFNSNSKTSSTSSTTEASTNWTCSMHPQINLPEFGECPICLMDLIPMNSDGNSSNNPLVFEMSKDAVKLANIQTTKVGLTESDNSEKLRVSGKIQADESKSASLVTHIAGRIEKLYVSFTGESVRQGQLLARIYSPTLITAQQELLEAKAMEYVNPKLLEATINKLKYLKITDKQIERTLETGVIQESFEIYAEHTGIVSNRRVSVGDYLPTGGILFDIQNLNSLWVLFDVYEENLKQIAIGDIISFTTPALAGQEFSGKISFINPLVNAKTRAATVRVEVSNKNQLLKPEMFVTGLVEGKSKNNVTLTIPKSAVLWTGTRSVVYLKVANATIPSFEFREVILGEAIGNQYPILEGIAEGDEVVTQGAFVIDASAQLNNQASMMNRNVAGYEVKVNIPDYTKESSEEFKNQLQELVQKYLNLKNDLVETNPEKSQNSGQEFLDYTATIKLDPNEKEARKYWKEQLTHIIEYGTAIAQSDDIESQRIHFDYLSNSIITSIKAFGVNDNIYYVQHCPMVNDDQGAFWISSESQIRNPYFGDVMLQCGTLEDTLQRKE